MANLLNDWERNFLADVRSRVMNKQPVSREEKQIVLDLMRRTQVPMSKQAIDAAAAEGFNVTGLKSL